VCASCCFAPTGGGSGGGSGVGVRVRARLAATASVGGARPGAVRIWRAYIYIYNVYMVLFLYQQQ